MRENIYRKRVELEKLLSINLFCLFCFLKVEKQPVILALVVGEKENLKIGSIMKVVLYY